MFNTKEKKERRLGVKLFLKPNRCLSPKCVSVRRPTRPGVHGKARRRVLSEFGQQLHEKQKFQFSYGLKENQMKKIFIEAVKNPEVTGDMIVSLLERRLDNVVFRLGFTPSRSVARQAVSHGNILVNGKKVKSSSYRTKVGDVITVRNKAKDSLVFKDMPETIKKLEHPVWLEVNPETGEGKVVSSPKDYEMPFDVNLVVDYYSKVVK